MHAFGGPAEAAGLSYGPKKEKVVQVHVSIDFETLDPEII
jgi:hypothetical protein